VDGPSSDALTAALEAVWPGRAPEVAPLQGGITNRNYLVTVSDERFVLRLAGQDTHLLGIDRAAERAAAEAAAAAGVGPEVVAAVPELGCLVTRFVEGAAIPIEDLRRDDVLGPVVRSVRAIHEIPSLPSTFPVFRIVEGYARLARERGVRVPDARSQAAAAAARIEAAFAASPVPPTACHNDLLNANLIREGDHVWIVDYEYAGVGDPFFDLGNLSINNDLDDGAQEALLRAYLGTVTDHHRARLGLMRIVSDYREAMWGVVQQAISTLDFDYVDYAERHFARMLGSCADARFEAWLDDVRAAA
jgi:thiamine kinase-like enzyme